MGKAEDNKAAFDAAQSSHKSNPLPRIGRMILCVISMGMVFPNAFTENINMANYEEDSRKEILK